MGERQAMGSPWSGCQCTKPSGKNEANVAVYLAATLRSRFMINVLCAVGRCLNKYKYVFSLREPFCKILLSPESLKHDT